MGELKLAKWRFDLFFGLLVAAFAALAGRVVYLQFGGGGDLARLAARQQRRVMVLPARPGNIYARTRGGYVLLAGSKQVPTCYADPVLIGPDNLASAARKIAAAVGGFEAELYRKMYERRDKRFVYLLRNVSAAQARALGDLKLRGVGLMHEWRRHYPSGSLAAQAVGFRRVDGVAGAGIELQADSYLRSRDGVAVMGSDAARTGSYGFLRHYRPPVDGRHVFLTLDVIVQGFLEQALAELAERYKAAAAWGVVMEPDTGEILAVACAPGYDPNDYAHSSPERRRNRAVTDPYEPGSCFKLFIAAGAVQMNAAALDTEFFCHNGIYHAYRGGTIRDFPGMHFGQLPLAEIVIHSSNIGMAKLGEHLGNWRLHRIASAFGFGRRTGADLPGESPGRLVSIRRWTPYATRRLPFGQGPIMVTALQMTTAFSAIANGGELLRPRIVDHVVDADGALVYQSRRRRIRRVLSRRVARQFLEEVLVNVVERGTGKRARLRQWRVFGKTGTAQIGGPNGYEERAYTATFVGGAPAARPAAVCVISVYRPDYSTGYTGGKVAAPYVGEVLEKTLEYLETPPDKLGEVVRR